MFHALQLSWTEFTKEFVCLLWKLLEPFEKGRSIWIWNLNLDLELKLNLNSIWIKEKWNIKMNNISFDKCLMTYETSQTFCFTIQLVISTKHLRGLVGGFEWLEILSLRIMSLNSITVFPLWQWRLYWTFLPQGLAEAGWLCGTGFENSITQLQLLFLTFVGLFRFTPVCSTFCGSSNKLRIMSLNSITVTPLWQWRLYWTFLPQGLAKGQLILELNSGVFKSPKKATKF